MLSNQPRARAATHEPTLAAALGRVVEAGQQLVVDRIDLGRHEIQQSMQQTAVKLALLLLAGVLGLGAWVTLQIGLVMLLDPLPVVSLFAIAIANGGLATMAFFYAMRKAPDA